mgnify:CR=1 FL=1
MKFLMMKMQDRTDQSNERKKIKHKHMWPKQRKVLNQIYLDILSSYVAKKTMMGPDSSKAKPWSTTENQSQPKKHQSHRFRGFHFIQELGWTRNGVMITWLWFLASWTWDAAHKMYASSRDELEKVAVGKKNPTMAIQVLLDVIRRLFDDFSSRRSE